MPKGCRTNGVMPEDRYSEPAALDIFSIYEAALFLGIDPRVLRKMACYGLIQSESVKRKFWFSRQMLTDYLKSTHE